MNEGRRKVVVDSLSLRQRSVQLAGHVSSGNASAVIYVAMATKTISNKRFVHLRQVRSVLLAVGSHLIPARTHRHRYRQWKK